MPDANITKSALASSMKRLMKEKGFSKISVIDICNGCGMNRKSFYYHFKDKYDLVNWIFYNDFIGLVSQTQYNDGWQLIESLGELFYRDQDFYKAAIRIEGQNSFRDYFMDSMTPILSFFISGLLVDTDTEDLDLIMDISCNAFLAMLVRWLEKGCDPPPHEYLTKIRKAVNSISVTLRAD